MTLNSHTSLFFLAYILSMPATAGWFGPDDYDECILESMQGVKSDVAAYHIRQSCREKFPKYEETQEKGTRPLTSQELRRITGTANKFTDLSIDAYNGNDNITISELTVSYTRANSGEESTIKLRIKTAIAPLTTSNLIVSVPGGEFKSWGIVGARGY